MWRSHSHLHAFNHWLCSMAHYHPQPALLLVPHSLPYPRRAKRISRIYSYLPTIEPDSDEPNPEVVDLPKVLGNVFERLHYQTKAIPSSLTPSINTPILIPRLAEFLRKDSRPCMSMSCWRTGSNVCASSQATRGRPVSRQRGHSDSSSVWCIR